MKRRAIAKSAPLVPENDEERKLLDPTPQSREAVAIESFSLDDLSLVKAIDKIAETGDALEKQGFSNLYFELDFYGYDGGNNLNIKGTRLETPLEVKGRISAAEMTVRRMRLAAQGVEKKERAELKRLKKKYPDG